MMAERKKIPMERLEGKVEKIFQKQCKRQGDGKWR